MTYPAVYGAVYAYGEVPVTIPNESNLPEVATVLARTASGAVLALVTPAGVLAAQGGIAAQSLNGSGTAPGVAAGAGAGAGASIGTQKGHDLGGSFVITTAGTPAAGALATVTFGTALAAAPVAVVVTCWDNTGAAAIAVGVTSVSGTGFTVSTGATVTTAHALLVNYTVVAT